jgi:NosR/NirI family nitrous oxide reductase transcriptional regulator
VIVPKEGQKEPRLNPIARYARWLHLRWPAGGVEPLPRSDEHGRTNLPGVYIAGDLTGIPLLKFALDTGVRAVRHMAADPALAARRHEDERDGDADTVDLVILGAGVSGMAAALEARTFGLSFLLVESGEVFTTIRDFPRGKPIYTYPMDFAPRGALQVSATVKEALLDELVAQAQAAGIAPMRAHALSVRPRGGRLEVELAPGGAVPGPLRARRVLVALGRCGDYRKLGVPGEDRAEKVFHRLHDPRDFAGRDAIVVGGGDTALETAAALAGAGARVTLSHRGESFARAKPGNVEAARALASTGALAIRTESRVTRIGARDVELETADGAATLPNDVVFVQIGRDAPEEFFRRSRLALLGGIGPWGWAAFAAFLAFCTALYNWKSGGVLDRLTREAGAFPYALGRYVATIDPGSLLGVVLVSAQAPAFWYTVVYTLLVVVFGIRRIRRRKTPYVTVQTVAVTAIQVLPLFLLPEILLPWMGHHGLLPAAVADALFPAVNYGHGREYWRAYGFILAWPLNVYNVFTPRPLPAWIAISILQTLVVIPFLVWKFGKGAYCGWICSCGALAETLGDTHREKMPHGPAWNRLNLVGQGILAIAVILLAVRVVGWTLPPEHGINRGFDAVALQGYKWTVDVFLAGVIGYGAYFWFSGRVWCRFACPLAAWMHVIARFSRFRIFAEKKKCISCNVCTSVCHQGIDVMSFANKGLPMEDPQCVRCGACVQACPTAVLSFGAIDPAGGPPRLDRLEASPVRLRLRELEGPARREAAKTVV